MGSSIPANFKSRYAFVGHVDHVCCEVQLEHNVARFTRADRRGLIRLTEDRGAGKQEGQMCRAEDEERNCRNRQEASLRYPSRVHFAIAAGTRPSLETPAYPY
jgi:hypothetical protein